MMSRIIGTQITIFFLFSASLTLGINLTGCSQKIEYAGEIDHATVVRNSQALVPMPPWPKGDERGMANTLGIGTSMRCCLDSSDR